MEKETRITPASSGEIINQDEKLSNIIPDETLVGAYNKILKHINRDCRQTQEVIDHFKNIVMNDGDSTSASKEALVNLLKIKSDARDKEIKIAELMTRIKLKDRSTWAPYMGRGDNNLTIIDNSNTGKTKAEILDMMDRKQTPES